MSFFRFGRLNRSSIGTTFFASASVVATFSPSAHSADFDETGTYVPSEHGVLEGFESTPTRYLPQDSETECAPEMYETVTADDALEGSSYLHIDVSSKCAERFQVELPSYRASYKATLWMRHGALSARLVAIYPEETGLGTRYSELFPSGRATSDGWVELESNPFSVQADLAPTFYVRVTNFAAVDGTDIDALELVPAGDFHQPATCYGQGDPACRTDEVCAFHQCVVGENLVPPLPEGDLRNEMVDTLKAKVNYFFGGKFSREEYLPESLEIIEGMRKAETAWQFWNGFGEAVRALHDWHTHANLFGFGSTSHMLNACFFEGDADLSQDIWPSDPTYPDILVSHAGSDALGLRTGDRLVAIDGQHPIEWVLSLRDIDYGAFIATDKSVYAELAERMGGPTWGSGSLIIQFANNFTIVRCSEGGTCNAPETLLVEDLPEPTDRQVYCDNRPYYHLTAGYNPSSYHQVGWDFFRARIAETEPEEKIFGMVWDTLYGDGDPSSWVNSHIQEAIEDWKTGARGVILDHRAGNGGTLDAAENLSKLVRPREVAAIVRMPMREASYSGPLTDDEGRALFNEYKNSNPYIIGSGSYDQTLPVALITHRDGSASDYMPWALKGAPNVRIFGPHATAGAFSTYITFQYPGNFSFQLASGDTISSDGKPLIGRGVVPDVIVSQKQSDLALGRDTIHEAALAWIRTELRP